jgi:hypothetical protein
MASRINTVSEHLKGDNRARLFAKNADDGESGLPEPASTIARWLAALACAR